MPTFNPVYERAPHLYLSTQMHAPLAEQTPNVVQFELTTGCSHNACSYCGLFKGVKYRVKKHSDFRKHVDMVMEELERRNELGPLERIYIGGGDALSASLSELKMDIPYAIGKFRDFTGKVPSRVAMYASVNNILDIGKENLRELHCGGTCRGGCSEDWLGTRLGLELIYLGLETGSEALFKEINKGYDINEMYEAISILKGVRTELSHLRVSAFVMPGLGGVRHSRDHINGTVKALNKLEPRYINLTSIMAHPGSLYARKMEKEILEGTNRPLTSDEIAEQIARIIERLDFTTRVGCFDNTPYLGTNTNPIQFETTQVTRWDSRDLASRVRSMAAGYPN